MLLQGSKRKLRADIIISATSSVNSERRTKKSHILIRMTTRGAVPTLLSHQLWTRWLPRMGTTNSTVLLECFPYPKPRCLTMFPSGWRKITAKLKRMELNLARQFQMGTTILRNFQNNSLLYNGKVTIFCVTFLESHV